MKRDEKIDKEVRANSENTEIAIRQVRRLQGEEAGDLALSVAGAPDDQVASTKKLKGGYYEVVLSKPKKKSKDASAKKPCPQATPAVRAIRPEASRPAATPMPEASHTAAAAASSTSSPAPAAPPVGRAWRDRALRQTAPEAPAMTPPMTGTGAKCSTGRGLAAAGVAMAIAVTAAAPAHSRRRLLTNARVRRGGRGL
jgi:hypothetical protein